MLNRRQKYAYYDTDHRELKLISVGHAVWRLYQREVRLNGVRSTEAGTLLEACQTIWGIKKQLRKDLAVEREARNAKVRLVFAKSPTR